MQRTYLRWSTLSCERIKIIDYLERKLRDNWLFDYHILIGRPGLGGPFGLDFLRTLGLNHRLGLQPFLFGSNIRRRLGSQFGS